jgi:N-acetylglutamate synthase-like GNAT family acetyltransferase
MIRKATRFDKKDLMQMLLEFNQEYLPEYTNYYNEVCIDKQLTSIIAGAGIALIEEGKGFIIGVISPCFYDEKIFVLSEMAWFVRKEYRNTSVGYRLFKSYLDESKELKEANRIHVEVISKLHNSPDIHYQKYGFKKLQESWMK